MYSRVFEICLSRTFLGIERKGLRVIFVIPVTFLTVLRIVF